MKNLVPEVFFKTSIRDEPVSGENPYKWKDQTTYDSYGIPSPENILKDLKQ